MKKTRKRNSMRAKMTSRIILYNLVALFVLLGIATYVVFNLIINEVGAARIDLLKQISESNLVYLNTMENVVGAFCENLEKERENRGLEAAIQEGLAGVEESLESIGWEYSFDVILHDGTPVNNDGDGERVASIKKTYWYIQLWSMERSSQWNLSIADAQTNGYKVSYAVSLPDETNNSYCIVVMSCVQQRVPSSIVSLMAGDNKFYILNENGTAISHTNPHMIGWTFYYMPLFEELAGPFNGYAIQSTPEGGTILLSNYYCQDTGWTYIEELRLSTIFSKYYSMLGTFLVVILVSYIFIALMTVSLVKRYTTPLAAFASDIKNLRFDENDMPVAIRERTRYSEIEVLTQSFNLMLGKMLDMVAHIRQSETDKRNAEYEFLQAQIEPHFLHNTLLAVKGLIVLGETGKAVSMMEDFNELLRIPLMRYTPFVTLMQEIGLVRRFISIMEYRYDIGIRVVVDLPEAARDALLPRMILQPIVDNSIFHGFENIDGVEDATIGIRAYEQGDALVVRIADNGAGMDKAHIADVMRGKNRRRRKYHGVGIPNVIDRIKILYGPGARLWIESEPGVGTKVFMLIPNYREFSQQNREGAADADYNC